jgi:hypothetical protein
MNEPATVVEGKSCAEREIHSRLPSQAGHKTRIASKTSPPWTTFPASSRRSLRNDVRPRTQIPHRPRSSHAFPAGEGRFIGAPPLPSNPSSRRRPCTSFNGGNKQVAITTARRYPSSLRAFVIGDNMASCALFGAQTNHTDDSWKIEPGHGRRSSPSAQPALTRAFPLGTHTNCAPEII